jgi:hypothetical protein
MAKNDKQTKRKQYEYKMAKIPNSDQSPNASRNYKSGIEKGKHRPQDIPEVGSGV